MKDNTFFCCFFTLTPLLPPSFPKRKFSARIVVHRDIIYLLNIKILHVKLRFFLCRIPRRLVLKTTKNINVVFCATALSLYEETQFVYKYDIRYTATHC